MVHQLVTVPLKRGILDKSIPIINKDVPDIFEYLYQVQMVSDNLRQALHKYINDDSPDKSIAVCFNGFPKLIQFYNTYINFYHSVGPHLSLERQQNRAFDILLIKAQEKMGDTITSYLIMPVQRPPRYRLLVHELIKFTPKESPEYPALQKALDQICDAINKIDRAILEFDEAVSMADLSQKLVDFQVFTSTSAHGERHLYFQGEAIKFSRKWTNNRYIVVFSDLLLVAEPAMISGTLKPNKIYPSGDYMIADVKDNPPFINSVDIRQKDKSFRINLTDKNAKIDILKAYQQMLKANKLNDDDIDNKGFAPVWIPDDQAPNCMECSKPFTFINRRHHCRYCGSCICKNCLRKHILPGRGSDLQNVCTTCFKNLCNRRSETRKGSMTRAYTIGGVQFEKAAFSLRPVDTSPNISELGNIPISAPIVSNALPEGNIPVGDINLSINASILQEDSKLDEANSSKTNENQESLEEPNPPQEE